MKRLLWTILAVSISTGIYFTIRYGLRPKPIPVMAPTEFADLEQVGTVMYKRLRQNVRAERLVLLGSRAGRPLESRVWQGFLKAAAADGEKIVFFPRVGLDASPGGDGPWETVPVDEDFIKSGAFPSRVLERIQAGRLVVVHGRTDEVTHLVPGSIGRHLEELAKHPILSISTLPLAVNPAEREVLDPPCTEGGDDRDGQRRLGCAAQRVARKYARKALAADKIWAASERHGLKEYLVFLHDRP